VSTYNELQSTYNQPGGQYNSIGAGTSTQTFTARAYILKALTVQIQSKTRILTLNTSTLAIQARLVYVATFSSMARLSNTYSNNIQVRASVRRVKSTTISAMARLRRSNTATTTLRGRILKYVSRSFTSKSRIIPTISFMARIAKRQGWPEPEITAPGYDNFTFTALRARGNIRQPTFAGTTVMFGGRIEPIKTWVLTLKANINTGQHLQIGAFIQPRFSNSQVRVSFDIDTPRKYSSRMVFYIGSGAAYRQQLQVKARISQTYKTRVTGHLIVPIDTLSSDSVIVFTYGNASRTGQLLSMKARVSF